MARPSIRARRDSSTRGATLLEAVLSVLILSVVGLAVVGMMQRAMIASLKAREQMNCSRALQTGFARLKNIDFYQLFAADTSLNANHGLQATYTYKAVLTGMKTTFQNHKFDRFKIQVAFMRRDTSDANANGMDSDLIAFTDSNGDLIDDYDSNIRYLDQNTDGDYYDTYTSGGRTVAEQPDTHLKQVTLEIYRRGKLVCTQSELISLEQFSGDINPNSESVLNLLLSAPSNSAFLHQLTAQTQIGAFNLAITKAYPAEPARYRADILSALTVSGETDPLATVNLYMGSSGILASAVADADGAFSAAPSAITTALVEGTNELRAQATKSPYTSPIAPRDLILDVRPPKVAGELPLGTVGTRSPYVAATLSDPGTSTTTTSGICPDVTTLKANGTPVYFAYSPETGSVVWLDPDMLVPPTLVEGDYTMVLEAGDYAGYKTSATWNFTVDVPATDNSSPAIANKAPIGMAGSTLPQISVKVFDNQSGIIPASIVMTLDGATIVDSTNIGPHYDPAADTVMYVPDQAFESGSIHTVTISVSHWAVEPPDKITDTAAWTFTVP